MLASIASGDTAPEATRTDQTGDDAQRIWLSTACEDGPRKANTGKVIVQDARATISAFLATSYMCHFCRVQRLPGIESARLGLDSLSGKLDEFEFDSYLNTPTDSEATPVDMHSLMEAQLKLQTKPASRGI